MPLSRVSDPFGALSLYARYCHAVDGGDPDAVGRCFSEQGLIASGRVDDDGRFIETSATRGRGRIVDRFRAKPVEREGFIHDTFNVLIESSTPDTLDGSAYFRVLAADGDIECMGRYTDRLVFTDGEWLFQERRVHYTWGYLGRLSEASSPGRDRQPRVVKDVP